MPVRNVLKSRETSNNENTCQKSTPVCDELFYLGSVLAASRFGQHAARRRRLCHQRFDEYSSY